MPAAQGPINVKPKKRRAAPPPRLSQNPFTSPLGNPIRQAQRQAHVKTQRAVARQPQPRAVTVPPYRQIKQAYDRLPPSKRGHYLVNLPDSPQTRRLAQVHVDRRHRYNEGKVSRARFDLLYGQPSGRLTLPPRGFTERSPTLAPPPKIPGILDVLHPGHQATVLGRERIQGNLQREAVRSIRSLASPGLKGKTGAIGSLRDLGLLSGTGPVTRLVQGEQQRQYRQALEQQAFERAQAEQQGRASQDTAFSGREIMDMIRGTSSAKLEALLKAPPKVQAMGLNVQDPGALLQGVAGIAAAAGGAAGGVGDLAVPGHGHFFRNLGGDIVSWPVGGVLAGYQVGQAVVDPKARKQFAKGLEDQFTHLSRSFQQHPLYTAAILRGATAALGRGVGGAARALGAERADVGGVRSALGNTWRAPLNVDGATFLRTYSKDPAVKAGQVLADRMAASRHGHGPVRQVFGRDMRSQNAAPRLVDKLRGKGNEGRVQRFADLVASRANSAERVNRETQLQYMRHNAPVREHGGGKIGQRIGATIDRTLPTQPFHDRIGRLIQSIPGGKKLYRPERDIVAMVNEGTLRTGRGLKLFHEDLIREAKRIAGKLEEDRQARHQGEPDRIFTPDERQAARQRLATVERVLSDPKAMNNLQGVVKSAKAYAQRMQEIQAEASRLGAYNAERGNRAMVQPFLMAHGRAVEPPSGPAPTSPDGVPALAGAQDRVQLGVGEPIGNATRAINEFMQAGGDPSTLAFVPHSLKLRGGAAMHRPFAPGSRGNFQGTEARTGSLFAKGASPHDYTHLVETVVGKSNLLTNIHEVDQALQQIGMRRHDGKYLTAKEAEYIQRHDGVDEQGNRYPGYRRLVPLRAFSSRSHDVEKVAANQDPMRLMSEEQHLALTHFNERANMEDKGARNVVLVPEDFVKQLKSHMTIARNHAATGQMLTAGFRRTVLPFSTKWIFGNTFEAALRTVVSSAQPIGNATVAKRLFQYMIEEDARALHGDAAEPWIQASQRTAGNRIPGTGARAFRRDAQRKLEGMAPNAMAAKAELQGGLLYGNRGLTVHRHANETVFGPRGQQVANLPVVHETAHMLIGLTDGIFAANRAIEREFERGAIGKYTRDRIQQMTGSWAKGVKMQEQAMRDVAKGMLDTPAQHHLANYLDEVLGQYSRFSPQRRNFIQTFAPFLPWYLNAVRFVAVTLPFKRPITTALLASAQMQFQKDWNAQHKDLPPGSLKTAIPHKGGFIDVGRFTPFGFLGPLLAGDLGTAASPLLPQVQGIQQGLAGKDPFGRDLQVKDSKTGKMRPLTQAELLKYVLNQGVEELVPGVALGRRLQEGGRTALPTSTVLHPRTKPGTAHGRGAVDRVLNPLSPVYLKPKKGGGSGNFDFSTAKGPNLTQGFDFSTAH